MEKIGIKYGLLTAAGLVIYFFLMNVLNLTHHTALHFLNGIIMTTGVVMAIRAYKRIKHGVLSYFSGLGVGVITAIVGTLLFAVFMVIYVNVGGADLLETLSSQPYIGERINITPGIVIFSVLMLEGVMSGAMVSFIAMQYFKTEER